MKLNPHAVLIAGALVMPATPALAETIPGTTLSLDFQDAFVQGSGSKIRAFKIPVTDRSTGKTTFYDAEFNFTISPQGIVFDRVNYAEQSARQTFGLGDLVLGAYAFEQNATSAATRFTWSVSTGLTADRDPILPT